jgi:uncharacterized protein (DUF362 family)
MTASKVVVLRTRPETVLDDYARAMDLADWQKALPAAYETVLKLNLSWTKYYPACSSQPWQVEGVVRKMIAEGREPASIHAVENKTVVTDPWKGAWGNKWLAVLQKYGLQFIALPEMEWEVYPFKSPLLKLNDIFPEGIMVPKLFQGRNVLHLPTVKTHGHSITTGAIKNAFGGLLMEVRHYAHEFIHEVMVDLMYMQKELHTGVFAVMDGTVAGDGAGPRTMKPRVMNTILASSDMVAIDSIAARLMGFDPMSIPYLRMCQERGLGVADIKDIEIVGDAVEDLAMKFETKRSLVIWGDQMLRKGPLKPLQRIALHSPAMVWAPFASNVYHDYMWYPTIGRRRIAAFNRTEWGKLWSTYQSGPRPEKHVYTNTVKWHSHMAGR